MLEQVGKTTLGGLLALGYQVAVSFKRESAIYDNGKVSISIETIDDINKSFIQVKGTDRKVHFFGQVNSLVQLVCNLEDFFGVGCLSEIS